MDVNNLPEQCVPLLRFLINAGSASQKDLIESLNLPLRSIRYGLRKLKEEGLIVSRPDLLDMRSLKYEINNKELFAIELVLKNYSESAA